MNKAIGKISGFIAAIVLTICSLFALTMQDPLRVDSGAIIYAPYIVQHRYVWTFTDWMPPPRLPRFLRPYVTSDGLRYTTYRVVDHRVWMRRVD